VTDKRVIEPDPKDLPYISGDAIDGSIFADDEEDDSLSDEEQLPPAKEEPSAKQDTPSEEPKAKVVSFANVVRPIEMGKPFPAWMKFPKGFKIPKGIEYMCVLIRAEHTHKKHKGDRCLILWPLNSAEHILALKRASGDPNRIVTECAKIMIRAIDGYRADWSAVKNEGCIETFWNDIGMKGRNIIEIVAGSLMNLGMKERVDFLENCLHVGEA
jgi:hypothetical protein